MMQDTRIDALAAALVNHSTQLARGEHVLIELFDAPDAIGIALMRAARAAGASPFIQIHHAPLAREFQMGATAPQLAVLRATELARMKKMQAYIAVRGSHNITELSDVPEDRAPDGCARCSTAASTTQSGSCFGGRRRPWRSRPR